MTIVGQYILLVAQALHVFIAFVKKGPDGTVLYYGKVANSVFQYV
jgi:hypothetical protein